MIALYVRGYNGQKSTWYQAAVQKKAGRIVAAGMTKEVTFEPVAGKRHLARELTTRALRRALNRATGLNPTGLDA